MFSIEFVLIIVLSSAVNELMGDVGKVDDKCWNVVQFEVDDKSEDKKGANCEDYAELVQCGKKYEKSDKKGVKDLREKLDKAKQKNWQDFCTTTARPTTTPKLTTTSTVTTTHNNMNTTGAGMNLFASNARLVHFCGFVLCAHAIAMHHRR